MENLGLDPFLMPSNSPIAQSQGAVGAYVFDYENERNAITNSKISFLSADKIAAGTVIVSVNLGSSSTGFLLLDGPNNRILVNDGTTNRIVIGEVA